MSATRKTPEVMIDNAVHKSASHRAALQDVPLAAIIRQIIQQAASAPFSKKNSDGTRVDTFYQHRPSCLRKREAARGKLKGRKLYALCECRTRVRFTMNAEKYDAASVVIRANGHNLTEVIENGLTEYGRTGDVNFFNPEADQ